MSGQQLLLIEPDTSSAAFMRHMLTRAGYQVSYAPTGKEGLILAWRDQPDAIILELDLPDIDGLEVVEKLRNDNRTHRKRVICLTHRSGAEATETALNAGVDEYLVKQVDAVELLLRTLAPDQDEMKDEGGTAPIRPGRVIAFMGAKGGIGTSSLCLNLAQEIAREEERRTAVLDLVLPLGFLGRISGAQSPYDVVELTSQLEPQQLTPQFLRNTLPVPKSWNFHLVPGAKDPAQGAKLDADRLAPLIQSLRAGFHRVIVDLGRTLSPLTMLVLRQTDLAVMVFSPEPEIVGVTAAVLRHLENQGIPRRRFFLLSNRPQGTEDMASDELTAILTRQPDASVPHLGPNMTLTNRLHAPLELRFPEEGGTEQLRRIAHQIVEKQQTLKEQIIT